MSFSAEPRIGQPVSVGIGRVHYGMTRWIGTTGANAAESYTHIPATGEIRPGESILVIGAGGPMGQMHVIRTACSGIANVSIVGTDVDDARIAALHRKAEPLAKANKRGAEAREFAEEPGDREIQLFCPHGPGRRPRCGERSRQQARMPHQYFRRDSRNHPAGAGPGHLHRQSLLHVRHERLGHPRHEDRPPEGDRPPASTPTAPSTRSRGSQGLPTASPQSRTGPSQERS